MQPANPNAGEPVTFTETATAPPGTMCCYLSLSPMDESTEAWQPTGTDNSTGCATVTLPQTARRVVTFTFNKPGRIDFFFQTGTVCSNGDAVGILDSYVAVGPGPSTSQGPSLPVLQVDDGRAPSQMNVPNLAVAFAEARDADGYIAGFSVDWGDGSPVQSFPGATNPCVDEPEGWPAYTQAVLGGTQPPDPPSHTYAEPEPRVITVTVVSTGCDGTDPQQVSGSFPWVPPTP